MKTKIANTATANNDTVWVAKGTKGRVTAEKASEAIEKYMKEYGKAGNIMLSENKRENGMLFFSRGCRMYKGTIKSVIEDLKREAIARDLETEKSRVAIAESKEFSNVVAGQIYGDVKTIRSKLASWKKQTKMMKPDDYKEYEAYQKAVLALIVNKFMPRLPKEYQQKIKDIQV